MDRPHALATRGRRCTCTDSTGCLLPCTSSSDQARARGAQETMQCSLRLCAAPNQSLHVTPAALQLCCNRSSCFRAGRMPHARGCWRQMGGCIATTVRHPHAGFGLSQVVHAPCKRLKTRGAPTACACACAVQCSAVRCRCRRCCRCCCRLCCGCLYGQARARAAVKVQACRGACPMHQLLHRSVNLQFSRGLGHPTRLCTRRLPHCTVLLLNTMANLRQLSSDCIEVIVCWASRRPE